MDILEFITLVITGFTSCAEFGSYAFVHPVKYRSAQWRRPAAASRFFLAMRKKFS